jgi:MtfA peptidase
MAGVFRGLLSRRRDPLPESWEAVTARALDHWRYLDDDERARLRDLMAWLLGRKRWEAAQGFGLTDEMRVVIAAQASLLILGLDVDCYRDVTSIIVHPTTMMSRQVRPGPARGVYTDDPFPIIGEAHDRRGPVLIAWDAARADARHPHRGRNVVIHEFAHKLDMLDNIINGTPPLPDREARQRWIDVCTREYRLLRAGEGGHLVDLYAATNPGEFFAVVSETFFSLPAELAEEKPDLYAVLSEYFRQDPAARVAAQP